MIEIDKIFICVYIIKDIWYYRKKKEFEMTKKYVICWINYVDKLK